MGTDGRQPPRPRLGKRIKNTVIYHTVALLIRALRVLLVAFPHRAVVGLGAAVGELAGLLGRRERARALRNIGQAFPALSGAGRRLMVRRMFQHMGRNALECLIAPRLRRQLRAGGPSAIRFEPGSLEQLVGAVDEARGVIFVTAHLGNWELMAMAVAARFPTSVLYKASYDPRFSKLVERFRNDNGVTGVEVGGVGHLRSAIRTLRRGRILGILLDQPVVGGCEVSFFGAPAPTSMIVPGLEQATGASVVVGTIRRVSPCQHAISIRRVEQSNTKATRQSRTQTLTSRLEEAIRHDPTQWIWSLDRWRSTTMEDMSRARTTVCKLYTSE